MEEKRSKGKGGVRHYSVGQVSLVTACLFPALWASRAPRTNTSLFFHPEQRDEHY